MKDSKTTAHGSGKSVELKIEDSADEAEWGEKSTELRVKGKAKGGRTPTASRQASRNEIKDAVLLHS
jgi:hypothetical protein